MKKYGIILLDNNREVFIVKFRKLMLTITFTICLIFVIAMGGSYAYYATSSGSVSGTTSTNSFNQTLGIVFTNSDHIDLNTGVPISSSDVTTKAGRVTFNLTPSADIVSDYDVNVNINLSNIEIDNELKVSSFKYRLICASSITNTEQTFNGTASAFTSSNYTIASLSSLSSGNDIFYIDRTANSQSYSCTLYIWLEDNESDQNSLMGKHFGANVEIDTVMKKR